jgi:hypothetical protein
MGGSNQKIGNTARLITPPTQCHSPVHGLSVTVLGVRRDKAALSSGCKSHPANAPAASNRSSHGGNKLAEHRTRRAPIGSSGFGQEPPLALQKRLDGRGGWDELAKVSIAEQQWISIKMNNLIILN